MHDMMAKGINGEFVSYKGQQTQSVNKLQI